MNSIWPKPGCVRPVSAVGVSETQFLYFAGRRWSTGTSWYTRLSRFTGELPSFTVFQLSFSNSTSMLLLKQKEKARRRS